MEENYALTQQATETITQGRQATTIGDWKSAATLWIGASKSGSVEAALRLRIRRHWPREETSMREGYSPEF
ncbi:hypothetical protein Misp01_38870 [Microtetraspora sp. NBRC 13810]|nr:hypothetical protein Misp01_38870 [Microtetraspora sp. NBRC 13810]